MGAQRCISWELYDKIDKSRRHYSSLFLLVLWCDATLTSRYYSPMRPKPHGFCPSLWQHISIFKSSVSARCLGECTRWYIVCSVSYSFQIFWTDAFVLRFNRVIRADTASSLWIGCIPWFTCLFLCTRNSFGEQHLLTWTRFSITFNWFAYFKCRLRTQKSIAVSFDEMRV